VAARWYAPSALAGRVAERRWALDPHTTIAVNAGFFTGGFLKETGPADEVAFSNVGITYRF